MRIRLRHPGGVSTITIDDSAAVGDLRLEIEHRSGFTTFELRSGYPPQPLELDAFDDRTSLADTGLNLNGVQLIVSPRSEQDRSDRPAHDEAPGVGAVHPVGTGNQQPGLDTVHSSGQDAAHDSPEVPIPSRDGTLVLRVMPDDNSCLFRALSYVMLGPGFDSMHELRSLVASTIDADSDKYSHAILGRPREEYCKRIQTEQSWGGYVELSILASHFDVEIASINVQDGRVDRYNEGAHRRSILVYSGIHYDAVALSPADRLGFGRKAEPAEDIKVFASSDDIVLATALHLCQLLREQHYYTDTANFTITCNICGWSGSGERGATEHAMATGHMNFGES